MKLSSVWPPDRSAKIVLDRLRHTRAEVAADIYQRRHRGVPWMPQSAVEILDDMLKPTDRVVEWGSGASTSWLAARTARVVSAEHDPEWLQRTRRLLAANGADVDAVRLVSVEPLDRPSQSPYVRIIDEFQDGELDVAFIDGEEHRATCGIEAVTKLASGGLLVVDDSQSVIDHPSGCAYSRAGQGAPDADWARFAELVKDWRLIWTGDRYSDAAIWIKP